MKTINNYIHYDKSDLIININNLEYTKPKYFNRAIKCFRYNIEANMIERYCSKCKNWYPCLIPNEDTLSFNIISSNFHFHGSASGFKSTCNNCLLPSTILEDATNTTDDKSKDYSNINIKITEDLKDYCFIKSRLERKNLTEFVTSILEDYKNTNPISL
ncbi:hypothetical protein [Clostridium sp.]|uniref:hypothetical protein n=1 Tax=Clostridium sp. TaxID=1506 RepID=UPI0029053043|nr:hypothetical protein [Clostridium sp.]MDU1968991.1 hypothetical protein [Clostridium perfringens]MDU1823971.1 hypothetical protein [Clostridium sp.]MDU1841026.1 hypothetical protein [Clostridium sp.]MDU2691405.1 hypothetical protein [Clostridium sp.]MDU2957264.1 hypothetical protein [Clostridium sp.]